MTVIRSRQMLAKTPPADAVRRCEVTAKAIRDWFGPMSCAEWEQRFPQYAGWDIRRLANRLVHQLREMR